MSTFNYITEDDIALGYSSEPDECDPDHVRQLPLKARPNEIYVGNTGRVRFESFFQIFKPFGTISDMVLWRTHDHLYHARITYKNKRQSDQAIKEMNHKMVAGKRLRVSYVDDRIKLDFPAAIRIDNLNGDVTEENIYKHFSTCGEIRFVIKTGYAAYIQFAASTAAAQALMKKPIMEGDTYTLSRIARDDRIFHVQVIENMKDIKYRKPFVMVENYPQLPAGTPLSEYKRIFESIGTVRHFKIAPTLGGTVTLALCMDNPDDRDLVIDRFNESFVSQYQLKLYMAPGRARMAEDHVRQFASVQNTIEVDCIRSYYSDYDVSMLFDRCGTISFLERIDNTWIICFDDPSAVSLALSYTFKLHYRTLEVREYNPVLSALKVKNIADAKQNLWNLIVGTSLMAVAQQKAVRQVQEISRLRNNLIAINLQQSTNATAQPTPSTSQPQKRPAESGSESKVANPTSNPPKKKTKKSDPPKNDVEYVTLLMNMTVISNLPKGIEEYDLRVLLDDYKIQKMKEFHLFCSRDLYHPSSVAYIKFHSKHNVKTLSQHHHDMYRGKRLCIHGIQPMGWYFAPERSVMLKNLPKYTSEEGIREELEKLKFKVVDVLKPAHHYAYVDFSYDVPVDDALVLKLQNELTAFEVDVFPLYRRIPKTWMHPRSFELKSLEKAREACGAVLKESAEDPDGRFGAHNAHKLFVGNLPRDTQPEDIIDYFSNYGTVIDYAPIKRMSCYLRKSVVLSFVNARHAQNAYRQMPHHLEGSALDVHLMDSPPGQFRFDKNLRFLTVKSHSLFLTSDEVWETLQSMVIMRHHFRLSASDERDNFFIFHKGNRVEMEMVLKTEYINDEAVKIVEGFDLTPPTEDEAPEKADISDSPYRKQKERYLSFTIYQENLKEEMKVATKPNRETDLPFRSFHDDISVQINNISLDTSLEELRELFVKCGDIVDYRAVFLKEDGTKICCIRFKTDLAAELATTYNQRMVNGTRILVHLSQETLQAESDRSILVERLNLSTSAEQLHDSFSTIGVVKYVQKQSPFSAIVCFKDKESVSKVADVKTIPNSNSFVISPCNQEYDPRFFSKFSCQEEVIPDEQMQEALKPRILPEFHLVELDRREFDNLPDDTKRLLKKEVYLAHEQIPNFRKLSRIQQISALKMDYKDFTQKEHFFRLTAPEQEKLLGMTGKLRKDEVAELDCPPPPKLTRYEAPVSDQMGSHSQQGSSGLQQFGGVSQPSMTGWVAGGMGGPPDNRWMQQRRAEMTFNVDSDPQGSMSSSGLNAPPPPSFF